MFASDKISVFKNSSVQGVVQQIKDTFFDEKQVVILSW
jgi:hypothetical protein